jgi:hypothetical protein
MSEPSFRSLTLAQFIESTGAKSPTPGGGAVAGLAGALAAALGRMVVNYSLGKKNLADHQPRLADAEQRLHRAAQLMLTLADEDAAAYGVVNELSRLPEGDPRREELPGAQAASTQVPLTVAAAAVDLLRLFRELASITNPHLRSDLGIAAVLARATVEASRWNVMINLPSLPQGEAAGMERTIRTLVDTARTLAREVEDAAA